MNSENLMNLIACWKTVKLRLIYEIHIGFTAGVTCQQRMSTEDAYSSYAPDPIHLWYLQRSVQARVLLWIVPFTWPRYSFGLRIFRLLDWHTDSDCVLIRFPDLDTSILTIEFFVSNGAHGGCVRSTGDAYSLTSDPTSGFSRGPCLLNFLDLYLIRDLWDCSLHYFFILMG
jgi:hypothetical protein